MITLADAQATAAFGTRLAAALQTQQRGCVIYLAGELGAGKTALTRAVIRALGHEGRVVSPTYTLLEPYRVAGRTLYHMDLYRLGDPEELEFIGVREIESVRDWLFVEWAERGEGFLPPADIQLQIEYADGAGRRLRIQGDSPVADGLIATLENVS